MLKRILVLALLAPLAAQAAAWKLDPSTTVTADVNWEGKVVTVQFPGISGDVDFDQAHPERAKATITLPSDKATTGVPVVDALLRSKDYLGAGEYPTITFQLDTLNQTSKSTASVAGEVTLRGVTKPLQLDAKVTAYGPAKDDPTRFEAGFDLTGQIDRTQFGSEGGLPNVAATMPVRIRLLMTSE